MVGCDEMRVRLDRRKLDNVCRVNGTNLAAPLPLHVEEVLHGVEEVLRVLLTRYREGKRGGPLDFPEGADSI